MVRIGEELLRGSRRAEGSRNEMQESDFNEMADLPEELLGPKTRRRGESVEGEIVRIDDEGIVISVGLKMEGMVPMSEMRTIPREELAGLKPGDTLLATLVSNRGPGDMALLSVDQAREELYWRDLEHCLDSGETVEGKVTGLNGGGIEVDYRGIRGFVPFSHLAPAEGDREAADRVGEECPFNVLEVDQDAGRLVLTEREVWRQRQEVLRQEKIAALEPGSIVPGRVVSVRGFGAFVDLGGVQGLVHISELSWGTVKDPADVVSIGEEINVFVVAVDLESQRINLSLKRTMPEPWDTVPERYRVGEVVEGSVTSLAQFGAFVRLEDGVEGLVHISELSARRVNHAKECVYPGQTVRVMVTGIDSERRRMSLSYRKAFGL